jgi:hypothetical protein
VYGPKVKVVLLELFPECEPVSAVLEDDAPANIAAVPLPAAPASVIVESWVVLYTTEEPLAFTNLTVNVTLFVPVLPVPLTVHA